MTTEGAAEPAREFSLIRRVIERLGEAAADDILVPPGDDGAAWREDTAGAAVATIDLLAEGTHWRPDTMTMADVGWRAVAANVSDLAAMGAVPLHLLVGTVVGPTLSPQQLDCLIDGLAAGCLAHEVRIVGGDIVRGASTSIAVAAYGRAAAPGPGRATALLERGRARPGDAVAVSGTPGASAAGLRLIDEGRSSAPGAAPLLAAHRRPEARTALGQAAIASGIRCAIDISDGLLQDLSHVARASALGIEVDCSLVPLHAAARTLLGSRVALDLALGGGEDFELLLAGDRSELEQLGSARLPVTVIGSVVDDHRSQLIALGSDGQRYEPPTRGWDQLSPASAG